VSATVRRRDDVLWRAATGFLALTTVDGVALQAEGPAAEIWVLLADEMTIDELSAELALRHDTDVERIRSDIEPFIERLVDEGYLERHDGFDE